MNKSLVISALTEACRRIDSKPGLLLHSDRGSQYCSKEYQKILGSKKFICSISRKNNCWDNALSAII
ncbi:MAG: hypothetical protein CVV49_02745 [Spirochaetae bacterium HGW-Spirochaetae-5]|nr:MAG: hypothetical protein CVV49_02745 [Spirochaetae bacterium HGW-Spirochaetae-5]